MELNHSTHVFFVWPARDEPLVAGSLLIIITSMAIAAGWAIGNTWIGIGVWLALLSCCLEMWLPAQTFIDPAGVRFECIGRHRRVAWAQVQSCQVYARGIRLYCQGQGVNRRTLFLRFGQQREEMLAVMQLLCPSLFGVETNDREEPREILPMQPAADTEPCAEPLAPDPDQTEPDPPKEMPT